MHFSFPTHASRNEDEIANPKTKDKRVDYVIMRYEYPKRNI